MADGLAWDATEDGFSALPIKVIHPPVWTVDPERGTVSIPMRRTGGVSLMHARVLPVLANLHTGVTLARLVRAYVEGAPDRSEQAAARAVRALVTGLVEQGNLRITIPPVPPLFAGRFRVIRELGRGGVGIAWLSDDLEAPGSAPVVVKHAWNWSGPLAERDASIRAEGDVLQAVDHPGVTRFVDRFDVDGRHHIVRAFADGEDLLRLRVRQGPMPLGARLDIVRQVADVLSHLHARGFLCLDLNPSNFLLGPDGRVLVADLGHARSLTAPLKGGTRWGAEGYVAPDLAKGDSGFSPRADVYGLGALAWFLATGKPPSTPAPRAEWPASVAPEEREFLRGCLAPDAADRPATPEAALALVGPVPTGP